MLRPFAPERKGPPRVDSVISIGSQSLLDGLVRLLGPALQPLRSPLPVAVPGLANAFVRIRSIEPVVVPSRAGHVELRVQLELGGEALLVASVAAGTVNLALGSGTVALDPSTGHRVEQPARDGTVALPALTGTVGGVGGGTVSIGPASAPVTLPEAPAALLTLGAIVGTVDLPDGGGDMSLPLPAVVPVAVDLTRGMALTATVLLTPRVNGMGVSRDATVDRNTGFGLQFGFDAAHVDVPLVLTAFQRSVELALEPALDAVVAQLLRGLPADRAAAITQPTRDLPRVAREIAGAVPAAVAGVVGDAFSGLVARTGRLVYPSPGTGASCQVGVLPTAAKARLIAAADGALALQLAFSRVDFTPADTFPPFEPADVVDVQVAIGNPLLLELLCCTLEKLPTLSLVAASRSTTVDARESCCQWSDVVVNLGVLSLKGTLDLCVSGAAGAPKTVELRFNLENVVRAGADVLTARVRFTVELLVDLSDVTSITNVRAARDVTLEEFSLSLGAAVGVLLGGFAWGMGFVPGLAAATGVVPPLALHVVQELLKTTVRNVLMGAQALESPVAIPPGVFDAFGKLVPVSVRIDDLDASGVLETPTSPWAVLPLVRRVVTFDPIIPDDPVPRDPTGPPTGPAGVGSPGGGTVTGPGGTTGPESPGAGPTVPTRRTNRAGDQ